jgi:hypothetical protein
MRTIFAFQDAVYPHTYSGNRHETYADTPAGVCALKAAGVEHQFVVQVLDPTAVSVLQVSAIHNLLLVLLAAELSVITALAAGLVAATVAMSTVVVVFRTCTLCAILD